MWGALPPSTALWMFPVSGHKCYLCSREYFIRVIDIAHE